MANPLTGRVRTFAALVLIFGGVALVWAVPTKTVVCFGDSITAGYGLDLNQSYPMALERLLVQRGMHVRVLNQGVSGNTTKDALARVQAVVALHPDLVVVEFGGNDGLRGLPLEVTRKNLDAVVSTLQEAHIRVLLLGITLPPNYGKDYISKFDKVYTAVAAAHHARLYPMIYDGIYSLSGTIQADGIHPTAKGSELIAQHLLPALLQMLGK